MLARAEHGFGLSLNDTPSVCFEHILPNVIIVNKVRAVPALASLVSFMTETTQASHLIKSLPTLLSTPDKSPAQTKTSTSRQTLTTYKYRSC
jgi:hypothetical protein